MKPNKWMESPDFLSQVDFYDRYYFVTLCKYLSIFLKSIPVTVITTWDPNNKRIYFTIGQNNVKFFQVDHNISYFDYITLVKRYLENFYPQYEVTLQKEVSLKEEEIVLMRQEAIDRGEKFDLNDALDMKKSIEEVERGIIERITITNDEFVINVNGDKSVRMSGSLKKPFPLSKFLKEIRPDSKMSDEEKRIFIFENSVEVRVVPKRSEKIFINYTGSMMLNFFHINYSDLKGSSMIELANGNYLWGNFEIKFESNMLKSDCKKFLIDRGEEIKEN